MSLGNNCRRLCISTNLSCNLNCRYCYEHKDNSAIMNVSEILNVLSPILAERTKDGTRIKLHGGEPFLEFETIRALCEGLWDKNFPEEFMIHMTTNGTLIHGDIQDWLLAHKNQICLKLSIDGDEETHNINRPGSFHKIDLDFFIRNWPDINIKMTVSPWTIQRFYTGVKTLHELGFTNISTSFAEMVDWDSPNIGQLFYLEMSKLANYYLENPSIERCSFFKIDIARVCDTTREYLPCTLGVKTAHDFQTGHNYPCHLYFESTAGKKKSEALMSIDLTDRNNRVSDDCSRCPFINLCHTCYAANFIYRGATNRRDMSICLLQKVQFLVLAEFEYSRIIRKSSSELNSSDFRCMEAIKTILPDLKSLKELINNE